VFKNKETILFELKQEFKNNLPSIKFATNSIETALVQTFAHMYITLSRGFTYAVNNMFPQNAPSAVLDLWGGATVKDRLPSSPATGSVWVTGDDGTEIPTGTEFTSDEGFEYVVTVGGIIDTTEFTVYAVNVGDGNTLRLTLSGVINFPTLSTVTVEDASVGIFNSTYTASVIDVNTISIPTGFSLSGAVLPTTGFKVITTGVDVEVVSKKETNEANLDYGKSLFLSGEITGADSDAVVYYGGIGGGTSLESNTDYRQRILAWLQQPVTILNAGQISAICREVAGVSRIFLNRATPKVGKCQIFAVKDSSVSPLLTAGDITYIQNKIFNLLDITREASDYFIGSPYLQPINVTISGLAPDSPSMRESIVANLDSEINDRQVLGGTFDVDLLRRASLLGIDSDTGEAVQNLNITSPSVAVLDIGKYTGAYAISGTEDLTITINAHGIPEGEYVRLDFSGGSAIDGWYPIFSTTANTIVIKHEILTTSGSVTLYRNAIPVLGTVTFV